MGTMQKTTNAGMIDRYGARRNTPRSARIGFRSSLKKNFTPSAKVWNSPHGPAMFGPMRFCMSLMSLRSNQIMNITATSRKTKATTTFSRTTPTSPPVISPVRSGSIRGAPPGRR